MRTPLWCRVPVLVVDSLACVQSCNVAHGHDLSTIPRAACALPTPTTTLAVPRPRGLRGSLRPLPSTNEL